MESFKIENLSFTYSGQENKILDSINLKILKGEFVTLIGKSGSGKSTLLRLLKPTIAPKGIKKGRILFEGQETITLRDDAQKIGFVMQNPDNQIVTDKVYHELSFGLESFGLKTDEIRARVAEMASYFGIESWFYKKTDELSGGQKQLLNLASCMVLNPSVLILDEPTSQLDPISSADFLNTLSKLNREFGLTVILCEQRLEDVFSYTDRVVVLDEGKVIADTTPGQVGNILNSLNHDMFFALPAPIKVAAALNVSGSPVTIKEGRDMLFEYSKTLKPNLIPEETKEIKNNTLIEFKDVYFKYKKDEPFVIKGLNAKISKGELFTIVGGNGAGKTTLLSLLSGILKTVMGEILIDKTPLPKVKNLYNGVLGVVPQNPETLFAKSTVYEDLLEISKDESKIKNIARLCKIEHLFSSHPYDLSGGEAQRLALSKVLLKEPEILLLDEPTKGLDAHFKHILAEIINDLKGNGVTVIMVSHDIEFCAEFSDRAALLFGGEFLTVAHPREFFGGKNFYTTSASKMTREIIDNAVLTDDIIKAFGKTPKKPQIKNEKINYIPKEKKDEYTPKSNKIFGSIFLVLCFITTFLFMADFQILSRFNTFFEVLSILEIFMALYLFIPQKEIKVIKLKTKKQSLKTVVFTVLMLLLVPITIWFGIYFLGDRKYYFISILIILEITIPFFMAFENKKPKARELVIISVLCALTAVGRGAFFMLPQFKPVSALVIISGICFGGQTGFLIGAVSAFLSNFFFGQGPWTPWQMFAFGMIGLISGALFNLQFIRKTKFSLMIFGFFATFIIYGGIMNPSHMISANLTPSLNLLLATYISGFPFDIVHSLSTAVFLYFIGQPMIEKLERIKLKYN